MKTKSLVYCGLSVALITICSWIQIPMTIPFTMQFFAIFLVSALLGTKKSVLTLVVYILLGLVGVPVFSGFKSGPSAILGPTGGYIIGFVFIALIVGIFTEKFGDKTIILVMSMLLGMIICYIFGTLWFVYVFTKTKEPIGFMAALSMCVLPYIIPDICKMALAIILKKRLGKYINIG